MPDAPALPDPVLPDPVSYLWEAAHGLQHALTSLQRIKALALGAVAIKEMVSPPLSNFQFNPHAFHQPDVHHSAFRPPEFRPPTFHPPAFHPKVISSPKLQGNPECNYFL